MSKRGESIDPLKALGEYKLSGSEFDPSLGPVVDDGYLGDSVRPDYPFISPDSSSSDFVGGRLFEGGEGGSVSSLFNPEELDLMMEEAEEKKESSINIPLNPFVDPESLDAVPSNPFNLNLPVGDDSSFLMDPFTSKELDLMVEGVGDDRDFSSLLSGQYPALQITGNATPFETEKSAVNLNGSGSSIIDIPIYDTPEKGSEPPFKKILADKIPALPEIDDYFPEERLSKVEESRDDFFRRLTETSEFLLISEDTSSTLVDLQSPFYEEFNEMGTLNDINEYKEIDSLGLNYQPIPDLLNQDLTIDPAVLDFPFKGSKEEIQQDVFSKNEMDNLSFHLLKEENGSSVDNVNCPEKKEMSVPFEVRERREKRRVVSRINLEIEKLEALKLNKEQEVQNASWVKKIFRRNSKSLNQEISKIDIRIKKLVSLKEEKKVLLKEHKGNNFEDDSESIELSKKSRFLEVKIKRTEDTLVVLTDEIEELIALKTVEKKRHTSPSLFNRMFRKSKVMTLGEFVEDQSLFDEKIKQKKILKSDLESKLSLVREDLSFLISSSQSKNNVTTISSSLLPKDDSLNGEPVLFPENRIEEKSQEFLIKEEVKLLDPQEILTNIIEDFYSVFPEQVELGGNPSSQDLYLYWKDVRRFIASWPLAMLGVSKEGHLSVMNLLDTYIEGVGEFKNDKIDNSSSLHCSIDQQAERQAIPAMLRQAVNVYAQSPGCLFLNSASSNQDRLNYWIDVARFITTSDLLIIPTYKRKILAKAADDYIDVFDVN